MLKFLRKYNKFILVIGGSFLMVVFLLPQAIRQLGPNPAKIAHFKAAGKTYRGADLNNAARELQDLYELLQLTAGQVGITPSRIFLFPIQPENPSHWLLLVHEAKKLGLVGGPESGRDLLKDSARQTAMGLYMYQRGPDVETAQKQLEDAIFEAYRKARDQVINDGTPAEMVDRALAKLQGVRRLTALSGTIPSLSNREAALFGRRFLNTAVADVAIVGTGDFIDRVEKPTPEELQAHFEKYKDVDSKTDPNGIGYLRPAAVRVEALQVDRSVIRQAIELDPIEVNKYWRQNRDKFGDDFKVARASVESQLRTRKVEQIMSNVSELLRREFFKSTKDLPTLEGGLKQLPDDWAERRPSYEDLAARVNEMVGEQLALGEQQPARVIPDADWLSAVGLGANPAATASVTVGGQRVAFPQLAMSVLDEESKPGVQLGLTFGPIDKARSQIFYFRVLDARPESPPPSLAGVEERAREDLIDLRAYKLLVDDKEDLREKIVAAGGYNDLFDDLKQMVARSGVTITRRNARLGRNQQPLPAINDENLRNAVMDIVDPWDPIQVASDLPLEDRTLAVPLPAEMSVAYVVITAQRPMTSEEMRRADYQIVQAARNEWQGDKPTNPFSFNALCDRLDYEPLRAGKDEDEDEEPAPDTDAEGEDVG